MNTHAPPTDRRGSRVALMMSPALAETLFDDTSRARLKQLQSSEPTAGLAALGSETVAILTGWDTAPITDSHLDLCPNLRVIAHTGGSVRHLIPPSVFERKIALSHASEVLAEGVAEFTVMAILASLRRLNDFDQALRSGQDWSVLSTKPRGRLLRPRTVGLVGASRVGRAVIPLLQPFGCRLLIHDPYLSSEDAADLGVQLTDLNTLLAASEVLSLHAPLLPTTAGMIGAAELARLPDNTLVVNTARAGLVDQDALAAELASGRLSAFLDVFDEEPLPVRSRWRTAPHTTITPHIAALTEDTLRAQGATMIDEIARAVDGTELRYRIDRRAFDVIA